MGHILIHNDCFVIEKEEYEPGEPVRARFPWLATDTSYQFFIDAEDVREEYVDGEMVFLFTMPDHDVNMSFTSKNTMMYEPMQVPPKSLGEEVPLSEGEWLCKICGNRNSGRFCCECGSVRPKPEPKMAPN